MNKAQFPTRVATLHDVPDLEALINRAYVVEAWFVRGLRIDAESVRERVGTPNMWFLVIDAASVSANGVPRDGGDALANGLREPSALAGCVCLDCDGTRGHIALLAVDPAMQGHGLAAQLLRAAEQHCGQQMCCPTIELEVVSIRTELFPFYKHLGFVETGTAPFPEPEKLIHPAHLIVMQKASSGVKTVSAKTVSDWP